MHHLREIAKCINTTRPESLPAGITLYEAWFGRPPITWPERAARIAQTANRRQELGIDSDNTSVLDSSDNKELSELEEIPSDDEIFQLSELSKRTNRRRRLLIE